MPAYAFRCNDCSELTERVLPMGSNEPVACEFCDGPTHRIIVSFPHTIFDWKHFQTRDDNNRLILHSARAGKLSPASEIAGKRT